MPRLPVGVCRRMRHLHHFADLGAVDAGKASVGEQLRLFFAGSRLLIGYFRTAEKAAAALF